MLSPFSLGLTSFAALIRIRSFQTEKDDLLVKENQSIAKKAFQVEDIYIDRESFKAKVDLLAKLDESFKAIEDVSGYLCLLISAVVRLDVTHLRSIEIASRPKPVKL